MRGEPSPIVHHRIHTHRIACGVDADRRDPASDSWTTVTCRSCLGSGFVEVGLNRWIVYAPEEAAESVLLVLEGAAALIAHGRPARDLRHPMRRILAHYLEARFAGDAGLKGLKLRRFRARPWEPSNRPVP